MSEKLLLNTRQNPVCEIEWCGGQPNLQLVAPVATHNTHLDCAHADSALSHWVISFISEDGRCANGWKESSYRALNSMKLCVSAICQLIKMLRSDDEHSRLKMACRFENNCEVVQWRWGGVLTVATCKKRIRVSRKWRRDHEGRGPQNIISNA